MQAKEHFSYFFLHPSFFHFPPSNTALTQDFRHDVGTIAAPQRPSLSFFIGKKAFKFAYMTKKCYLCTINQKNRYYE